MSNPVITLTTDFGEKSGYVGVMKGVIYRFNPSASIVDISHLVEPQNIREGAFLLHTTHRYFAPNTIHIAVIDPGVGTKRRAICLKVPEIGYFIAPDNGLLTYILEAYPNVTVREILNPNFMLQPVSPTFHGRDIFAPTAALLSKDNTWENIGESLNPSGLIRLPDLLPQWHDDGKKRTLEGFVIHIDHFGNLITNISQELFKPYNDKQLQKIEVIVPLTYHIKGIQKTYGEAKNNKVIALFGSSNYLEVAKVNGNAAFFAESQYVKLGKKVKVTVDY